MRIKGRSEQNRVALTVIYILGAIAFVATCSSAFLINQAVVYEDGLNAAAVALVGQMVSIATLGLGALGAMLSSTSPKPQPPADGSTPVTVVNEVTDPVPTEPVEAEVAGAEPPPSPRRR